MLSVKSAACLDEHDGAVWTKLPFHHCVDLKQLKRLKCLGCAKWV